MRWNKGPGGDKVKPEKFKKNGYIKTRFVFTGESSPKQADNKWPFKESYADGVSKQGEEGKKKATRANQVNGASINMNQNLTGV